MYRKSMRSALEEARAYSAVNEVKVSKGGRTLDISKKDVGVYQAKGWSLQEVGNFRGLMMDKLTKALKDKLSKEGGAAGFDDLKKTANKMGVVLTPANLKGMPGIKQHRDGDYILEETIEEGISISNARKEIQKIYDTAKKAGILGNAGHDNFKELLKQTDRKKLYQKMHRVGSSFGTVGKSSFSTPGISGSVGSKIGKQLVDLSYKVNEETELEEATPVPPRDLMLTYGKPGEKVKAYYTKFMQDLQNKAHELRKKGFVVDKMGLKQPMSKLRDRIPEELEKDDEGSVKTVIKGLKKASGLHAKQAKSLEKQISDEYVDEETQLVEFTLADYRELESDNQHDIAAKKLIDKFGTPQEKSTINDINRRHAKTGYISGTDFRLRTMIVNKYYSRLK